MTDFAHIYPGVMAAAAAVAPPAFTPRYADFDGSANFALRGGALSGVSDGKQGIVSFWVIFDSLGAVSRYVFATTSAIRFIVRWFASTAFEIRGETSAGVETLEMRVSTALTTGVAYHICASWNLASAGSGRVYVNDASALAASPTYTNNTIDYTDTNYAIGAATTGGIQKLDGRLGELYVNLAEYLDFDTTSERRKFRTAGGAPVDLGASGAGPTGNTPAVYCSLRSAGTPNDFATNRGAGGGFTVTGALADGGAI